MAIFQFEQVDVILDYGKLTQVVCCLFPIQNLGLHTSISENVPHHRQWRVLLVQLEHSIAQWVLKHGWHKLLLSCLLYLELLGLKLQKVQLVRHQE